jgi:hypothetical protein
MKKWFPLVIALLEVFQRVMIKASLYVFHSFNVFAFKEVDIREFREKFSKKRKIFMINLIKENRFIIPEN